MERQVRVEEISRTTFFCGLDESLRRVIVPRAPSRCCSGSSRTSRAYLVKLKASRSRAEAFASEPSKTQSTHRNFIPDPAPFSFVAAARFHREQPRPLRTH